MPIAGSTLPVKAMQVNCVTKNGAHSEINGKKWVDLIFV
jgi:hypothetical protein